MGEENDAGQQLEWMEEELRQAEQSGVVVWIIGHVPPSYQDCVKEWSLRYSALIERYQHLIRFTTFGHIHTEEFSITRSLSSNRPITVEYISGNFGTFDKMNPTARLYKFHSEKHIPVDFDVYEFDIEKANTEGPSMEVSFSFKKDFGLNSLSPSAQTQLSRDFSIDSQKAKKYQQFKYKGSKKMKDCDQNCKRHAYCFTFTQLKDRRAKCLGTEIVKLTEFFPDYIGKAFGPWVQRGKVAGD